MQQSRIGLMIDDIRTSSSQLRCDQAVGEGRIAQQLGEVCGLLREVIMNQASFRNLVMSAPQIAVRPWHATQDNARLSQVLGEGLLDSVVSFRACVLDS